MTGETRCFGCYSKTRCTSCACIKGERQCLNCQPSMEGHCQYPFNPFVAVRPSVYCSQDASSILTTDGNLCQLTLNDKRSLPTNHHLTLPPVLTLSSPLQIGDLDNLPNLALILPSSNTCVNTCSVSLPSFSPLLYA